MCLALQNYQFLYSDKRYNAENRRHLTSRNMDPSIEVRGPFESVAFECIDIVPIEHVFYNDISDDLVRDVYNEDDLILDCIDSEDFIDENLIELPIKIEDKSHSNVSPLSISHSRSQSNPEAIKSISSGLKPNPFLRIPSHKSKTLPKEVISKCSSQEPSTHLNQNENKSKLESHATDISHSKSQSSLPIFNSAPADRKRNIFARFSSLELKSWPKDVTSEICDAFRNTRTNGNGIEDKVSVVETNPSRYKGLISGPYCWNKQIVFNEDMTKNPCKQSVDDGVNLTIKTRG